jgi:hypothetical protein
MFSLYGKLPSFPPNPNNPRADCRPRGFLLFWFWFFFAASAVSGGDSLVSSLVVKGVLLQAEVVREVVNTMFVFIFNLPRYELSSLIKPPNPKFSSAM